MTDRLPPRPRSRRLRRQLFIPALSRLLSDPAELPLDDSADSIRVRLDEAIRLVESRCEALSVATLRRRRLAGLLLGICLLSAFGALTASFLASARSALYLALAGVSVLGVFFFAAAVSKQTADRDALALLGTRYRPLLDRCEGVSDLRELSRRIGSEMARTTIDPGAGP